MNVDFPSLLNQTKETKSFLLIDTAIAFHSSDKELIDFLDDEIIALLPEPELSITHNACCIIESHLSPVDLSTLPRYSDSNGREICPPELGPSKIFSEEGKVAIVVENTATLYHSGEGDFVLLLHNDSLTTESGRRLNIQAILNIVLSEVLLLSGRLLAHAGAVGKGNSCEVWTGDSGAGKTTRILSLVGQGYDLFGDDQVIIGEGEDGFWYVWPYWLPVKVKPESTRLLDHLDIFDESDYATQDEKIIFNDMEERLKAKKPVKTRLGGIYLLIPGKETIYEELEFDQAFQGVSKGFMHSLFPGSSVVALEIVLDLLEDVSVYAVSWDKLPELDGKRN